MTRINKVFRIKLNVLILCTLVEHSENCGNCNYTSTQLSSKCLRFSCNSPGCWCRAQFPTSFSEQLQRNCFCLQTFAVTNRAATATVACQRNQTIVRGPQTASRPRFWFQMYKLTIMLFKVASRQKCDHFYIYYFFLLVICYNLVPLPILTPNYFPAG